MKETYKNGRHIDQELDKIASGKLLKVADSYDQTVKYSADAFERLKIVSDDMFDTLGPWEFDRLIKKANIKSVKTYVDVASPVNDVKKKRRVRENDIKLDLCLDFTACVDPVTFQFCPDSCVYSKFKSMVRSLTSHGAKRFWASTILNGQPLTKEILKAKINEKLCSEASTKNQTNVNLLQNNIAENVTDKPLPKTTELACPKIPEHETTHTKSVSSPKSQARRSTKVAFASRPNTFKPTSTPMPSTNREVNYKGSPTKAPSPDMESKSPLRFPDQRVKTADNFSYLNDPTSKKSNKYVKSRPSIPSKTNTFPLTIPDCCGKSIPVNLLPPINGQKLLPKTAVPKKNLKNI